MKHLIQSRAFVSGFALGIVLCGVLNYWTYLNQWCSENIYDCYWFVGFPTPFLYGQGGYMVVEGFIWLGVITDIFFAITASVFTGWVFWFVNSKTRTPQD